MLERPFSVLLTDLDGVVFWRIPAQKTGIPLLGTPNPERYAQPVAIYHPKRQIIEQRSLKSIFNAIRHAAAPVFPDVVRLIKELDNVSLYGNTGRPSEEFMIFVTTASLKFAEIFDKFDDIYFRPLGLTNVEAKASTLAGIRNQWDDDQIIVVDDNPEDLLPVAKTFPNIKFHLIRDFSTSRLLRGIDLSNDFPNVRVNKTLREALYGFGID